MEKKFIVGVDFDGTITSDVNWEFNFKLRPYSLDALIGIKGLGGLIWIYSGRSNSQMRDEVLIRHGVDCYEEMVEKLQEFEIPYDKILTPEDLKYGKPICDFFVDDRSIGFKGDWKWIFEEIKKKVEDPSFESYLDKFEFLKENRSFRKLREVPNVR